MNLAAKLFPEIISCKILLVDDDMDDCMFFREALYNLEIPIRLTILNDGEKLIDHLTIEETLPELIFLDLNMPRKNGMECLIEIKQHTTFRNIPVIICSTGLSESEKDKLHLQGAHYCLRKENLPDLKKSLSNLLTQIIEKKYIRPRKSDFNFL